MNDENENKRQKNRVSSQMPEGTILYEKVVPALLIGLGIIMTILILVAAGIATGIIPT